MEKISRARDRSAETERRRSTPFEGEEWKLLEEPREPLLSVRNLGTYFSTPKGEVRAVDGVSFDVGKGEIVGLVGESGCGKSATCRSLMRVIEDPGEIGGGEILFEDKDLLKLSAEEMRSIRGKDISMIFQEPMSAFNPTYKIGWQVGEPLRVHDGMSKEASFERAGELMAETGIPSAEDRVHDYPHEFSGGMLQRAMIAMALACEPKLLIADEPTTSLDVTIQAQILRLIHQLHEETGMSVLLVTHNLGVVAEMCDKIAVMYAGRIVEYGDLETVFEDPRHPYTKGLFDAVIDPRSTDHSIGSIPGTVPDLTDLPSGCNFENRCPYSIDECTEVDPRLREVDSGHYSACIWEDFDE